MSNKKKELKIVLKQEYIIIEKCDRITDVVIKKKSGHCLSIPDSNQCA
ncbi:MAG: hypothetical protein RR716_03215 [Christensenellaceae bacterium]